MAESRQNIYLEDDAPSPLGRYPHAVVAGDFVFYSGQGARDPKSGETIGVTLDAQGKVESYNIEVQTRAVLENLRAVVHASGLTFADLVDVTVFLRHMEDFDAYNRVYGEYFAFPNPPARTTVESRPPGHNFIEIKATGYKPTR
jgi:2-aminomuconate deaminase